jgi:hypothetical protein
VQRRSGAENVEPTLNLMMERDAVLDQLGEIHVPVILKHEAGDKMHPLQNAMQIQECLINTDLAWTLLKVRSVC